jgi:hypothetical protein
MSTTRYDDDQRVGRVDVGDCAVVGRPLAVDIGDCETSKLNVVVRVNDTKNLTSQYEYASTVARRR